MVTLSSYLEQRVMNKGIRNVRVKVRGLGAGRMVSVKLGLWLMCMFIDKCQVACKFDLLIHHFD